MKGRFEAGLLDVVKQLHFADGACSLLVSDTAHAFNQGARRRKAPSAGCADAESGVAVRLPQQR